MKLPKILVILGPTATGKSELAVALAQQFDGEIVSADSRQIYRGLDVGTGKVPRDSVAIHDLPSTIYLHSGIPHHLIDVADIDTAYTVADYKRDAEHAIDDILARGKLPIVVGGTGLYIQAIVDGATLPEVPPNPTLRNELEKKSAEELYEILQARDHIRAETIDPHNPRRLIRAIEIATALGTVPPQKSEPKSYALQIGLDLPDDELKARITTRVVERLEHGWQDEAQQLTPEQASEIGLGYNILRNEGPTEAIPALIATAEWHYAKRQRTWFKHPTAHSARTSDARIQWFQPQELGPILDCVTTFLASGV